MSTTAMDKQSDALSVSELNQRVKDLLESSQGIIRVQGEISNLSRPRSGHIYFTLKDSYAEISCAMFKRYAIAQQDSALLQEGTACCVEGLITLYQQRGQYQILAYRILPQGEGLLKRQYQILRSQLAAKGLFAPEGKSKLASFPRSIGILSSPVAAGLEDLTSTLKSRFPITNITVYPAQVQGGLAASSLIKALKTADNNNHDALVFCRGGGSIEDLWCFNDEQLAYAIHAAITPIVSAVGHETDWTICDEVCDVRAATPTQAALLLVPDAKQLAQMYQTYHHQLNQAMLRTREKKYWQWQALQDQLRHPRETLHEKQLVLGSLLQRIPDQMWRFLCDRQQQLDYYTYRLSKQLILAHLNKPLQKHLFLTSKLTQQANHVLLEKRYKIQNLLQQLQHTNPHKLLQKGYGAVLSSGKRIVGASELSVGQRLTIQMHDGHFEATVTADPVKIRQDTT